MAILGICSIFAPLNLICLVALCAKIYLDASVLWHSIVWLGLTEHPSQTEKFLGRYINEMLSIWKKDTWALFS
jgi:hypothetical protein